MKVYVETDRGKYIDVSTVKYAIVRPANVLQHPSHEFGRWVIDMVLPAERLNMYFKTYAIDYETRDEADEARKCFFRNLTEYFEEVVDLEDLE